MQIVATTKCIGPNMGTHRNFSREGHGLGDMAIVERQPIIGVWGGTLSGIQRQSPWLGDGVKRPLKQLHT